MLSKQFVQTLKVSDIPSNRLLFQLAPSVRPTDEIESGLLPTVQTQGLKVCEDRKSVFMDLSLLPTPRANKVQNLNLANNEKLANRNKGNLEEVIAKMILPTPNAAEGYKYCTTYKDGSQMGSSLTPLMNKITGQTSQLNPRFVADMMGFPPTWTELPFQSGEPKV